MKWILGLLIGMLIASPAFAQLTREEAQTLLTGFAQLTAKVDKINEELVTVKTDIAVMKADIAVLKTELRDTKTELKEYVNLRVTASEEKTSAEIRGITQQLSFVQFLLVALVTGLLTMLLALLKQQWDKRKAGDEKLGAQQKELTEREKELTERDKELAEKQSEIDALRAENERIKNTSGLVSPSGGRLENEVERGSG